MEMYIRFETNEHYTVSLKRTRYVHWIHAM